MPRVDQPPEYVITRRTTGDLSAVQSYRPYPNLGEPIAGRAFLSVFRPSSTRQFAGARITNPEALFGPDTHRFTVTSLRKPHRRRR